MSSLIRDSAPGDVLMRKTSQGVLAFPTKTSRVFSVNWNTVPACMGLQDGMMASDDFDGLLTIHLPVNDAPTVSAVFAAATFILLELEHARERRPMSNSSHWGNRKLRATLI